MSHSDHGHAHSRDSLSDLQAKLRENARRITGPRKAILDLLRDEQHPLTIKEIHGRLESVQCDLATIYRAMHLLIDLELVERFDFGDGVARFELKGTCDHGHHHHLVCTKCGRVVEIEECFPDELEKTIADRHGFTAVSHKLEFFGLCPDCQPRA